MRPPPLEPRPLDDSDDKSCFRVAFLVADGFERSELHEPLQAVREAGAEAVVITPDGEEARAWDDGDWADTVASDLSLEEAKAEHYDAVVLPGGVLNPDQLRTNEHALAFVQAIHDLGRPIAAICHGPWTLIDADLVDGRQLTSWPSLQSDLENAGAEWIDEEVVIDGQLITSRNPSDLPAFCQALLDHLGSRGVAAEAK